MFRLDLDSGSIHPEGPTFRVALVLSVLLIPLCIVATAVGLFVPGFYRDVPNWVLQEHAQDLVTLVAAIPLLAISLALARRGSIRGYLLWLGTIGYLTYSYAIYAFDVSFNALFLGYVAILGLSIYSLILGLTAVNPRTVAQSFGERTPARLIGWFLIVVCALVGLLWLADDVPAVVGGSLPASMAGTGLMTNPIHVLDLGIVLPGGILIGFFLARRRPLGYVLGGYFLVKFAMLGLGIQAINLFTLMAHEPIDVVPTIIFGVITVISIVLTWLFLRNVQAPLALATEYVDSKFSVHLAAAVTLPPSEARRR
jgi:hypothetical protein